MIYCDHCGVELETDMVACPLCGKPVSNDAPSDYEKQKTVTTESARLSPYGGKRMNQPQKNITWEIVTIVLISIVIATCIINQSINKRITWSEYPVAICLIIFSYLSMFAFWSQKTIIQLAGGFLTAAVLLFILDTLTSGISWALTLAIPLLLATNLIAVALLVVIRRSKQKGINLIAYAFLAAALLCISIEVILDFYLNNPIRLWWSVIVSACVMPVCVVLLFLHFRFKKGRDLEKTFHI